MNQLNTERSSLLDRRRPLTISGNDPYAHTEPGQIPPTLCKEDLRSYVLRARPQGPLCQIWEDIFREPLNYMPFSAIDPSEEELPESNCGAAAAGPIYERYETSQNWSGAYLLPTPGKRFVQVWGRWVVPEVRARDDQDPETEYQCSTWIGLDGQRQYANSTLPQIGTLQKVKPGKQQQTTAWVQWWQRDDPKSTPVTLDFPVEALDEVSCVLTVLTELNTANQEYEQSVLFNIVIRNNNKDKPKNNVMSVRFDPPMIKGGGTSRLWIPGATAEWVMERPAIPEKQTLQALANYGTTKFFSCNAAEATETSPDQPMPRDLKSPLFIRMYEVRDNRMRYISKPTRSDDTSFNVTFESQVS